MSGDSLEVQLARITNQLKQSRYKRTDFALKNYFDPVHPADVKRMAKFLEIKPHEYYLFEIARQALTHPFPNDYEICTDALGATYYANKITGRTTTVHPLHSLFRKRVKQARAVRHAEEMARPPTTVEPTRVEALHDVELRWMVFTTNVKGLVYYCNFEKDLIVDQQQYDLILQEVKDKFYTGIDMDALNAIRHNDILKVFGQSREQRLKQHVFNTWIHAIEKKKALWENANRKFFMLSSQILRTCFTEWRVAAKWKATSRRILLPVLASNEVSLTRAAFQGWRRVAEYHNTLRRFISRWKEAITMGRALKRAVARFGNNMLARAFSSWRENAVEIKRARLVTEKASAIKIQSLWRKWMADDQYTDDLMAQLKTASKSLVARAGQVPGQELPLADYVLFTDEEIMQRKSEKISEKISEKALKETRSVKHS